MPHRKAKVSKQRNGARHDSGCQDWSHGRSFFDLMVPLPKDADKNVRYLKHKQLTDRLEFFGYDTIALVHQVFGKPKDQNPDQIFEPFEEELCNNKKRKRPFRVFRRLHAIIENVSDVAAFTNNDGKLLDFYDLISIAPCSEAILHALCSSAHVDIITLDYTRGGLPFKLRPTHVQAAAERNIAMEIHYAHSIHHLTHRKAMIQTIRAIESASKGKTLRLIVSSGGEANSLRSPRDVANVLETLGCLHATQARESQCKAASWVIDEARRRRILGGGTSIVSISFESAQKCQSKQKDSNSRPCNEVTSPTMESLEHAAEDNLEEEESDDDDDDEILDVEDGFIML